MSPFTSISCNVYLLSYRILARKAMFENHSKMSILSNIWILAPKIKDGHSSLRSQCLVMFCGIFKHCAIMQHKRKKHTRWWTVCKIFLSSRSWSKWFHTLPNFLLNIFWIKGIKEQSTRTNAVRLKLQALKSPSIFQAHFSTAAALLWPFQKRMCLVFQRM